MKREVNIGIVGTQFMGKAHSNAYRQVPCFFDLPVKPIRHTTCGRNPDQLSKCIAQFDWRHGEASWEKMVENPVIDLIDICATNHLHMPIAIDAAEAGKHILCEKPIARNLDEAWQMHEAAKKAGVINMMVFNYRFVPAILLAKQLIDAGKIGQIRHFNAVYYQDWLADSNFPWVWRHDTDVAGSGAHGDMNAHIVDLARFLVGEMEEVNGILKTFIRERPMSDGKGSANVSADDATSFLATFQNGALGSFSATRLAPGRKNFLRLEIFGSKGSLTFNLERINELEYFSVEDDPNSQGYKNILVTEPSQPYMDAWWPPGHTIGWEHTFIHVVKTLLESVAGTAHALPDFYDGLKCQAVLDAVIASAHSGSWIKINEHPNV